LALSEPKSGERLLFCGGVYLFAIGNYYLAGIDFRLGSQPSKKTTKGPISARRTRDIHVRIWRLSHPISARSIIPSHSDGPKRLSWYRNNHLLDLIPLVADNLGVIHLFWWERDAPIGGRPALEGPLTSYTIPIEPERYAWDRERGESGKAYAAFQIYRDLGTGRTLTEVGRKLSKRKQSMSKLNQRWGWHERVLAYDRHMEELEMRETVKERV